MSRKKTHEEFLNEVKLNNKHFDDIDFLSHYNGIKNKMACQCKKCGCEWETIADALKMGCGCPDCGREKTKASQIRPLDSFLKELYATREDIVYVGDYANMKSNATFKCKLHNEIFKTSPHNALQGVMCPLCRKEKPQYNKLTKEKVNKSLEHLKIEMVGEYKNSKSPTMFKCKMCGNEFVSKYELVKCWVSEGCSNCGSKINPYKKAELVKNRIDKMYLQKSENVEILEYDDNCDKIKCKCLICGLEYDTSYDSLIQGSMHKNCASLLALSKMRLSTKEVEERVKSFGNNIDIVFSNYISAKSLLNCKCLDCGHIWLARQRNLIRGRGCPICAQKKRDMSRWKPLDEYKQLLSNMNLSVISQYVNATTPVTLRCNICGETFESTMTYISQNLIGCKVCSQENERKIKLENFIEKLQEGNSTIKLIGRFVDMSTSTDFLCSECGESFSRTPHDLLKSCNCPNCTTNSKLEYYIKIYLDSHKIKHRMHCYFDELRGVNGGLLSYDFYLPDYNLLIEAQGEQHEKPIEHFGGGEYFETQQIHDNRKREYAFNNSIGLLEIWYRDVNNINNILDKSLNVNIEKAG